VQVFPVPPSNNSAEAIQRISLKNREYAYIEDANRGVVLVEIGPKVLTLEAHLTLVSKSRMIELGTGSWCVVRNPVVRTEGKVALDDFGQARIAVGDREVRVGPQVFPLYPGEELEGEITPEYVLGVYDALRLRALTAFTDERAPGGPRRREAGDEWLVRGPGRYVPSEAIAVVSAEKARVLKETEYCVVLNPLDRATGRIQEGRRKVISGPDVFFLEPGEVLEGEVRRKHVLSEMQGLKLQALDDFSEPDEGGEPRLRKAGDTWIVRGPRTYVPNERVVIHKEIVALSLGQGEGLYVRDLRSGKVSLVQGPCQFMPEAHQELHEKRLSPEAEALLGLAPPAASQLAAVDGKEAKAPRPASQAMDRVDRTRAIVLRIEDNTAVLINDFETNHARVEFGPAKVMLRPYEDVTVLDLSGGTPKRPRQLKVLMLRLGPDFATDLFEVATRDHARLRIKLSYKWQFDVEGDSEKDKAIFRVNDFIGYVCENLASRIRQVAAENEFEAFHKNASVLIRRAIFGVDEAGKARKDRLFSENQLRIIDIDIKDIAPVDDKTALKLREAIDTNIQIQLDASRQEAQAAAELKRIRSEEEKKLADISSHRKAEAERQSLIELQNKNHQLATLSHAKVEAEAQLEKARVESDEVLARAEAEARASRIRTEAELERERLMSEMTLARQKQMNDLEVDRQARLAAVEADQFRQRVEALGGGENFVKAVAAQAQAAVVGGLDKVVFLPSGSNLNLFDSMQGLLGPGLRNGTTADKGTTAAS
jgi:major vault protein